MNSQRTFRLIELLIAVAIPALAPFSLLARDGFSDDTAIKAFLHDNFDGKSYGMVIGLVDEHKSRIFGAGKLDNGTDQEVNGDTVFGIGSVTKTFTTLLLQEMVERGEMKLNDPVAKYLPASVKMPALGGAQITLLQLATHTSGLPAKPDNAMTRDSDPYVDYTDEKLYSFLSGYALTNEPGTAYQYSDLGIGLLAQAIALKAGTNYESLVMDWICRPLHMDSTRITLTPELKIRLAAGHNSSGKPATDYDFHAMNGAGALRSTANDMLKYVSANLGLIPSSLTPIMEKTHAIRYADPASHLNAAMDWMNRAEGYESGLELLGHPGGTVGYRSFIGFDEKHRRGVVVLSNQYDGVGMASETIGWLLLEGVRLTPEITTVLLTGNRAELVGIGAQLDFAGTGHVLQITKIIPHSPASRAGLSPGLIMRMVNNEPTLGKSMTECLGLIRGKAGTKVCLELVDPKRNRTNSVVLIRQKFEPPKQ